MSDNRGPLNPFTAKSSLAGVDRGLSCCDEGGRFKFEGREGRVLIAVPDAGVDIGGGTEGFKGLLFGRTKGSAALGRRILIGGAPVGPVGVDMMIC